MSSQETAAPPRKKTKGTRGKSKSPHPDEQRSSSGDVSQERIRERAYFNWEAAGCPCSDGVEFWLQAESEMSAER